MNLTKFIQTTGVISILTMLITFPMGIASAIWNLPILSDIMMTIFILTLPVFILMVILTNTDLYRD